MKSLKCITRHAISLGSIQSRKIPIFQCIHVRLLITNFEKGRFFQIYRRNRFKVSITTKNDNNNIETCCYVIPYDVIVDIITSLKSKKRNRANLIELDRRKRIVNLSKRANNTFW